MTQINFSVIKDIATIIATITASCVAIYGVREWKRQLRGKTDYEIARNYLKTVLSLRESMKNTRNPFISVQEMKESLSENGLDSEESRNDKKMNRAVYSKRWEQISEKWIELELYLTDAEVSWGKGAVNVYRPLDLLICKLRSKIQLFLSGNLKEEDITYIYHSGENDPFDIEVDSEIEKIRDYLKRYLV
jgi:hypothetical protein